jgi:hypothetical protein
MKKYINLLLISFIITLGACDKSFLDLKPYDSVPSSSAITTEADMAIALNGTYASLRSSNLYGRGIPFINDLMADNIYISAENSGRYLSQYTYSVNDQNGDVYGWWSDAYNSIAQANNIIEAGKTITLTDNINQYVGEALTIRALMHFELVKFFGKPYTTDSSALGVPVITAYNPYNKPSRNKVIEVYTQIISDLKQAITLMTVSRPNSSYITKYVAQGLLAKVYLYQGDYANAQATAFDIVDNAGYSLISSDQLNAYWGNPVPREDLVETMFEISSDAVNNNGPDALASIYAQTGGYGDGIVSSDLYNLYSATDARKGLIISISRNANDTLACNKYQNLNNNQDKDDTKVLRYADIILILAESYYRTNDETNALLYLNLLAMNRDPSFGGYVLSGSSILDQIILERRKELAFEGDRFADLNRLGITISRNDQYPSTAQTIEASDYRRLAPVPRDEINANPKIKPQNDGY